jgi:hypothetical protein
MPIQNFNPTENQSPDSGQGGIAVDSSSDTGASAGISVFGDGIIGASETKTCRWFNFQTIPPNPLAIKLKIGHSSNGSLSGGLVSNAFTLQYSLNGGSIWLNAVQRTNFSGALNDTFSVDLSLAQDISQVQVRMLLQASAFNVGDLASASAAISDIRLEVETQNNRLHVLISG